MIEDPVSSSPVSVSTLSREDSGTNVNEKSPTTRRPTIILITPTVNDLKNDDNSKPSPLLLRETSGSGSLSREKSFKRERRNSFIPVFYVCKVYVYVNGSKQITGHIEPLLVEKDWTYDIFLTFASRHIDMSSNATRAFTRLGVEITDIFMLEDETDVYLSTGPDFIEPLIRNTHVTEHNNKMITTRTTTLPVSQKDVHHGPVCGEDLPIKAIGIVLEPIPASGSSNVIPPTGEIPVQAKEVDVSFRSHQVNFSSSTKESFLDNVTLPQDSTETTTDQVTITSVHDGTIDSSFLRLDVMAPVPIKTSRQLSMDDHSDITALASESIDSLASSTPSARHSEILSTTTSPAVGKGKRKEYVKTNRGSFSGSLDLDRIKVYIKANGEYNALFEEENPGKGLVVERMWSFQEFLTFAGRKIGMPNASRVFSRLGVEITDTFMLEDESQVYLSTFADFFVPLQEEIGNGLLNKDTMNHALRCEELGIPTTVSMYHVCEQLGDGGFGIVMLGIHKIDPTVKVALKFLRKEIYEDVETAALLMMEIQCLTMLKHKNILRLHDRLETPTHVVLSVDLMSGGDLLKYCSGRGTTAMACALPEEEVRHIFRQILDGVHYMHHQRVVHRDLKLENILMCGTSARIVKISDFGISMHLLSSSTRVTSRFGTSAYMPPELLHEDGTCSCAGPPLDYWALGNILFALICGRLPFLGVPSLSTPISEWPCMSTVENKIRSCHYEFEPHVAMVSGDDGIHDVIGILLDEDPSERTLLSHPWVRQRDTFSDGEVMVMETDGHDDKQSHGEVKINEIDQSSHRIDPKNTQHNSMKESTVSMRRDSGNKVDMSEFPFLGVLPGENPISPGTPVVVIPSPRMDTTVSPRLCLGQGNANALLTYSQGQGQGLGGGEGLGISGKGKQPTRKGTLGLVDHLSRSTKEPSSEFDSTGFDAMINSSNALKLVGALGALRISGKMNVSGKSSNRGETVGMGSSTMAGDPAIDMISSSGSSGNMTFSDSFRGQSHMTASESYRGNAATSRCETVDEEDVILDRDHRFMRDHSEHSINSLSHRRSPALGGTSTSSIFGNRTPERSGNVTPSINGNKTPELGCKLPSIDGKTIEDLFAKLDNADRLVSNMKILDKSYGRRNSVNLSDSNHSNNHSNNNSMHGGGSVSQKTLRRASSIFNKDTSKDTNKDGLILSSISSKNPSPTRFRVGGGGGGSVIDLSPVTSPQQQQAKLYCKLR